MVKQRSLLLLLALAHIRATIVEDLLGLRFLHTGTAHVAANYSRLLQCRYSKAGEAVSMNLSCTT